MKKTLSIMLTVLMCFSSIFGSIGYVAAADTIENAQVTYTIGEAVAEAGETVNIPVTLTSAHPVNLTALAGIKFSNADAEVVGFTYSDDVTSKVNKGLSNYDPDTNSVITLFNNAETFANGVVLGTLQVKIADNAADGEITISATATALDEFGAGNLTAAVVDGKIKIGEDAPVVSEAVFTIGNAVAEKGETITVDVWYKSESEANIGAVASLSLSSDDAQIVGFEFSDGAKAVINTVLSNYDPATKSIIALFSEAMAFDGLLGTLQIKIADDASEGDITITATSRVKNENTDEIVPSKVVDGKISVEDKSGSGSDSPTEKTAEFVIGEAEAMQGETAFVDVTFATETEVNLIALASVTVGDDAQIVGFEFSDEAKAVINTALSNYDPATKSLIVLFNDAQVFDGVLGTFEIKVADDAAVGEIAITASAKAKNENSEDAIEASVEAGSIVVNAKPVEADPAKVTFANTDVKAGETANIEVSFKTTTPANLVGIGNITFSAEIGEIEGFEFSQAAKDAGLNTALSNYDPATNSVIALFTNATAFDGVLGTLKVKVAEDTAEGDYTVTATSVNVKDEANETVITSEVTSGTISVEAGEPVVEPEVRGIEVTANAVEIAEADKASNAKIIAAVKDAITDISVKWTGNKADTVATVDEVVFKVDIANKKVVVTYQDKFTDEIGYTVAAPLDNPNATLKDQRVILSSPDTEVEVGAVVEIPVSINNPNTLNGVMVKVTWDPAMLKADPTKKMGKWNCYTKPADNADGLNMYGAMFDLNGNNAANGVIVFGGAAGYEFEDYTTEISLGTLKFTVLDAAAGRNITITVDSVGTYATSLKGNEVLDTPVNAVFKVVGEAPEEPAEPEMSGIEVTANAVEIADADKNDDAKIIEAVKAAITKIAVKWTLDKEDTTITTADVTYSVDTAAKEVTVSYNNFTDVVSYTVAAPIPVMTGIKVTANAVEIADADKADTAKITEAIKAAITSIKAQWTAGKADTDVAVADVTITIDTAAKEATVKYNGFTAKVAYTVAAPIPVMTGIKVTANAVEIADADKADTAKITEAIKAAITSIKAQWTAGKADTDVAVADVTITIDTAAKEATVKYNGFTAKVAYTVAAPIPVMTGIKVTANAVEIADADKADTAKITEAIKAAITSIKAQWTEGKADTDVAVADVTITIDTAAKEATVKYNGFTAKVAYTVAAPIPVMTGIKVTANAVEIADADKADTAKITEAIKAAITSIKAQWTEGKADTDVAVADVTITIDTAAKEATVKYNGFTAKVAYTVANPLVTGIKVEPAVIEVAYGTAQADVAKYIADNVKVYYTYEDGSVGTEAIVDFGVTINGRDSKATITKPEVGSQEIEVTYATLDAKLVAPEKVSVPYNKHNEKSDAEIAEYIKEQIAGKVIYVDIYGEEFEAADTFTVVYDDEKATVSFEGLEAEIDVTLKKRSGSSVPSGTVVRPGDIETPVDPEPVDPEPVDPTDPVDPEPVDPTDPVDPTKPEYSDVDEDDWAYDAIKDLTEKGVISGDAEGTLRPDYGITREEVAKIILVAKGIEVDESLTLDIVDPESVSDWAEAYVATAVKYGILKGYDDGTMKGNKIVTRAELATIIVRALNATSDITNYSFTDITAQDWFADYVECAKNLGIVSGYEDGTFRGNNDVTRREAFAMTHRMITLIAALEQ